MNPLKTPTKKKILTVGIAGRILSRHGRTLLVLVSRESVDELMTSSALVILFYTPCSLHKTPS
jgi:hypothetical protein